jgi:putative DNA methylase
MSVGLYFSQWEAMIVTVERHFDETYVANLAAREKQSQQHYRPVIGVHKWFARRPGSLFRALILAEMGIDHSEQASLQGHELSGVCLDPFMGGGTPVIEANRLGLAVIGYDTNAMSRWIVERELEELDPDELLRAGERVINQVETEVSSLYQTTCPSCANQAQVRYFLWVRQHQCECGREHPLLADTMVVSTGLKRHPHEVHLCPCCLDISEHLAGQRSKCCPTCHEHYDKWLVPPGTLMSCECGQVYRVPPHGEVDTPSHRLVATAYRCENCASHHPSKLRFFKTVEESDEALYSRATQAVARSPSEFWPAQNELVPRVGETARLLRWGYNSWRDLFTDRQLYGLGLIAQAIRDEPNERLRVALATCFSDLLRYQNVLCRFDRQALKPTDVFAVHGFPVPRVFCEPHLIGPSANVGSGGFRHMLAKYARAKRWCQAPYETAPDDSGRLQRHPTNPERVAAAVTDKPEGPHTAVLRCASMTEGDIKSDSVDLVLTDPPYYANVHYAELTDFSYVWLRRLVPDVLYFRSSTTKTDRDAVGDGNVTLLEYAERLSRVYVAATGALKPSAPFCFTYHHNNLEAYAAIVMACLDAGLVPVHGYGCPTEMRASTHIHGRHAATVDVVFILRKPPVPRDTQMGPFNDSWITSRLDALRAANVKTTEADRACLRCASAALQAMQVLTPDWDVDAAPEERLARSLTALGLPGPVLAVA